MSKISNFLSSVDGGAELLAEERFIVAVTEAISKEMERKGISKAGLAESLGCSKAHVSKLLGGSRNMTLRTLAAISFALDADPELKLKTAEYQADDDGWETDPQHIAKVYYFPENRFEEVAANAANDDEGWTQPQLVLVGAC